MSPEAIEILPAVYEETLPVLKTQDGREIKYIRRDEAHRMFSFLEGRDRLFVDLLWNTGARVSEALDITPSAVNFDESTITVRTLKKKKKLPRKGKDLKNEIRGLELALQYDPTSKILQKKLEQAKQRLSDVEEELPPARYRTIPIVRKLTGKLASYCMEEGLTSNDRLFPISRIRAYQIIQDAGSRAGIKKGRRHPHVFRHGFAVNAVLSGVPPMVLRTWMGHSDIQSTTAHNCSPAAFSEQNFSNNPSISPTP